MANEAPIEVVVVDSASSLLEHLRPTAKIWKRAGYSFRRWAYRGQRNASWPLIPSALRVGAVLGSGYLRDPFQSQGEPGTQAQMEAEFFAVHEFLMYADMLGVHVPGDDPRWRVDLGQVDVVGQSIGLAEWPPKFALETLAIAQHHGIPTRLLDFTYDPRVATFFAADDAHRNSAEVGTASFAIWAIDLAFLKTAYPRTAYRIRRVEVPRARNAYLHAQHGFFLYDSRPPADAVPSLDAAILDLGRSLFEKLPEELRRPVGYKIECPCHVAAEVLGMLRSEFIDRGHLMPSLHEAVRALQDHRASWSPINASRRDS